MKYVCGRFRLLGQALGPWCRDHPMFRQPAYDETHADPPRREKSNLEHTHTHAHTFRGAVVNAGWVAV
jgi:hypothetical protein